MTKTNRSPPQPTVAAEARKALLIADKFYDQVARLGSFGSSGLEPAVSDREIVAAFFDVRNFTKYVNALKSRSQDRLLHNFLHSYLRIFPVCLDWLLSQVSHWKNREALKYARELETHLVPAMFKTLGDGMLLVWELDGVTGRETRGLLTRGILSYATMVHSTFRFQFSGLTDVELDSFSNAVREIGLASGTARGHAIRLDFPGRQFHDYAGPPLNLASRLCGLARPSGMVVQLDVSRSLLSSDTEWMRRGKIETWSDIKGFSDQGVDVWIATQAAAEEAVSW